MFIAAWQYEQEVLIMKKLSVIAYLILIAGLVCSCAPDAPPPPSVTTAEAAVEALTAAPETADKEDKETAPPEQTYPEYVQTETLVYTKFEHSVNVEETDDTLTAQKFFCDITECWLKGSESFPNIDKYIDNPYLREFVELNLKRTISYLKGTYFYNKLEVWRITARVNRVEEINGINYVSIYVESYSRYGTDYNNSHVRDATYGIRDGKIVNILGNQTTIEIQHYVDGYDTGPFLIDSIYNPNLWDDEKIAKRAVESMRRYMNGEYESFGGAWNAISE